MIDVKHQQFKLEERQQKEREERKTEKKKKHTYIPYSITEIVNCTDQCENFNATLKCLINYGELLQAEKIHVSYWVNKLK